MSELTYNQKKALYDEYSKRWDMINASQGEQDAKYDKNLLLVSSGALGVSFAFIDKIVPLKAAVLTPFLVAAWGCFAVTIIAIIASFRASSAAHKEIACTITRYALLCFNI